MLWLAFIGGLVLILVADCQTEYANYGCPRKFHSIAKKCYHFSVEASPWFDSHHQCLKLGSSLLLVKDSSENSHLRRFLRMHENFGNYTYWLDGIFNHKKGVWQEGSSAQPIQFRGFTRMNYADTAMWPWHCVTIDPNRQNKWGASNCMQNNRYVCHMPNEYLAGKKYANWSKKCDKARLKKLERQLCQKFKFANATPGFLVKKSGEYGASSQDEFVCKPHMILVGRECYYFSRIRKNWNDAFFACKQQKTKLAMPNTRLKNNILKGFLNNRFVEKHERWIGGKFDEVHNAWIWAINAKPIRKTDFGSSFEPRNHTFEYITMDPSIGHQWSSANQFEKRHFICQSRPGTVRYRSSKQTKINSWKSKEQNNNYLTRDLKLSAPQATIVINTVGDVAPTLETLPAVSIEARIPIRNQI